MDKSTDARLAHERERMHELDNIKHHVTEVCKQKYGQDFGSQHPMYPVIMGNLDVAREAQRSSLQRLEASLEPIRIGDLFVVLFKVHVPNLSGSGASGATLDSGQHFTVFFEEHDEDPSKHRVVLLTPVGLVTTNLAEIQTRIAHGRIVRSKEDEFVEPPSGAGPLGALS